QELVVEPSLRRVQDVGVEQERLIGGLNRFFRGNEEHRPDPHECLRPREGAIDLQSMREASSSFHLKRVIPGIAGWQVDESDVDELCESPQSVEYSFSGDVAVLRRQFPDSGNNGRATDGAAE